jgi:DNA repair protein RadC
VTSATPILLTPPAPSASAVRTDWRRAERASEADLIAQVLDGPEPAADVLRWGETLARLPFWERRALGVQGLTRTYGVPPRHAVRLVALWELAERWFPDERPAITSARDAVLLLSRVAHPDAESMLLLLLDARYRVLGVETVALGSAGIAHLRPRDVLAPALRADAAAVVVAHSDPHGDASPSHTDTCTAMQLREAAAVLGVFLLDYVLIGRRGLHSFARSDGWTDAHGWTSDDGDSCY